MPGMHPAERKLGQMLCDFPGELASYSAAELSRLAGVSTATVSRFVRRLGYTSYEEARLHARRERETGSRLYLANREPPERHSSLQAYFDGYSDDLAKTIQLLDATAVNEIVAALLAARRIWTIGFRASHAFASYLRWQLLQVLEHVDAIPGGGQTLGEHLVSFCNTDLAIVFGLRRRVTQTDQLLNEIMRKGAKLLYITDESVPLRTDVTWHLRCITAAPGPLFSHVAVMAICHLIADRTIVASEHAGRVRLREIEAIHDALGEV
jgi:DNA-binding MurR/RpiR family transcriptional regulator